MRMPSILRLIHCMAAIALAAMPASVAADRPVPKGLSKDQLFGTVLKASRWDRTRIEVCWENPEVVPASYIQLTRAAVAETWQAKSAVEFIGWSKCMHAEQPGLRIVVDEAQPHTRSVGIYLDRMPSGMHLNFSFKGWRPECQKDLNGCARAVVVHEFGHALGFTHEQREPGAPAECSSEPTDIVGDYLVTEFDDKSVMSLCKPHWKGNGKLSSLDAQAVARFYGA